MDEERSRAVVLVVFVETQQPDGHDQEQARIARSTLRWQRAGVIATVLLGAVGPLVAAFSGG